MRWLDRAVTGMEKMNKALEDQKAKQAKETEEKQRLVYKRTDQVPTQQPSGPPRDLAAEMDYFAGVALAHEELLALLVHVLIDKNIISQDGFQSWVDERRSAHKEQPDHPEFIIGYWETLDKMDEWV